MVLYFSEVVGPIMQTLKGRREVSVWQEKSCNTINVVLLFVSGNLQNPTMSTFTCLNGLTISLDKLCDCTIDCPYGYDERYICECESYILSLNWEPWELCMF